MKPILSAILVLLAGCQQISPTSSSPSLLEGRTLTVFAAASLADAFTEIAQNLETLYPGIKIDFYFAGSQALRTQIELGADTDVFASANTIEMDVLVGEEFVQPGTPQIFVTNQLVLILPPKNPANVSSLEDLENSGLKLILAADEVPVGRYSRQVLENLNALYGGDYKDKVLMNVVSNEDNVKQVVTKVQLGEADAGIVYISDAYAAPELKSVPIPAKYNVSAQYPIAALIITSQPDLAAEFIAYVLSEDGQAIMRKWGFTSVNP